jgi:acyl-CoA synthetase (AMP-forming)/AMP-acid ligase II
VQVRPDVRLPFADLRRHGERVALLAGDERLTYNELADRVDAVAARLGSVRSLVLIEAANDVATVAAYLAALRGGHPVLLAAQAGELAATYDVDAVVSGGALHRRREGSVHDLHPDLALLLSTSGSTGSPKLVRLSHENLRSNAEAIATYLGIDDTDRAALTLPLHYCYGLSVLHSHLQRGASVLLSALSVVDRCFWDEFRAAGATSLAGVPYTFELLDRAGFEHLDLPTLRTITQAGGRLDPERVRRYARLGEQHGWRLVVMYGQTEATARMAYLPPELAAEHPTAIGVPIPGGSFRIDDGELVYSGPNVMLGYAETPADLGLGRTVHELRTGDLGRGTPEGLYEVTGRRNRLVKLFGLRIDLQQVERVLEAEGVTAACAGDDRRLVVVVTGGAASDDVRRMVTAHVGLPPTAVHVELVDDLPRLPNGKTDVQALLGLPDAAPTAGGDVRAVFAEVLQVAEVDDDDTFVGLGGDSLSYVEMSIRLEEALGHLPPGWHTTPVGRLVPVTRREVPRLETNVVLRTLSILLIVASHVDVIELAGGAHVLLAVAGYNFARFQLAAAAALDRAGAVLASAARVAVPSAAWIGVVGVLLTDEFRLPNVLLLHNHLGTHGPGLWRYWFVEAIVQLLVVLACLLAIPAVRRVERVDGRLLALVALGVGLLLRFDVIPVADGPRQHFMPHNLVWLFALGWAAQRLTTPGWRLLVSAVAVVGTVGFFGDPQREAIVAGGILLLVWTTALPVPRPLNRLVGAVAGASLYIYLTHYQVHPELERFGMWTAVAGSVAVGWLAWRAVERGRRLLTR